MNGAVEMTRRSRSATAGEAEFCTRTSALLAVAVMLTAAPTTTAAGGSTGRTVDLDYRFVVRDLPASAGEVTAWIPIPPTNPHQRLIRYEVMSDHPHAALTETEYGNSFLHFDLSDAVQRRAGNAIVSVRFRVMRMPARALSGDAPGEPDHAERLDRFLAPDRLVPINGKIALEARRVAGDAAGTIERARRLYDHIVSTVSYDKSGQGWGRGNAVYACDVRRGNCTDFHSLFIAEARALRIPARFIMGLPLPEVAAATTIPGYHCWAEFHVEGIGWIPLDASEASRHPWKRDALFGVLDANRIEFSVGRDIHLPKSAAGPVNYSIYPHVEVDGVEFPHVETTFAFREEPPASEPPVYAAASSASDTAAAIGLPAGDDGT